jgi:hypothetical protein
LQSVAKPLQSRCKAVAKPLQALVKSAFSLAKIPAMQNFAERCKTLRNPVPDQASRFGSTLKALQ